MTEPMDNVTLLKRTGYDPDSDDVIGAHQLTIDAGITYRQLDYWTRTGFLKPIDAPTPGSGRPRVYNRDQVDVARCMRQVIEAGITTPMALVHETALQLIETGSARLGDFTITRHQESA